MSTDRKLMSREEIAALPLFSDLGHRHPALLNRIIGTHRRRVRAGEIICREGERASSALYVLDGQVDIFVTIPDTAGRGLLGSLLDRFDSWMSSVLRSRHLPAREEPGPGHRPPQEFSGEAGGLRGKVRSDLPQSWVLLDSPRPFAYGSPVATLGPGSLFEELTCLNAVRERPTNALGEKMPGLYPRGVAARAATDCELLELDHPAILALRESATHKVQIEESLRRVMAEADLGVGRPLSTEELREVTVKGIRPFEEIARLLMDRPGSVVRRVLKKGEVLCRQGEFGSTAYIVETGRVRVFLEKVGPASAPTPPDRTRNFIPTDTVDLSLAEPIALLEEGDIVGEMTCMSFYPRSATVIAEEDGSVLEFLRNVLDLLKRSGPFKQKLDEDYRRRALANHLRAVSLFQDLPEEAIIELTRKATFLQMSRLDRNFKPIQDSRHFTICREGDPADSFYLLRSGTVRVTQRGPGGEVVLPYLSRGDYFGEVGLLLGGYRTATCEALDHVELVRLDRKDFEELMHQYAAVHARLVEVARKRQQNSELARRQLTSTNLREFIQQGLMQAKDLLVIDLNSCTRCDACVQACAMTHGGVSRLPRDGRRFDNYLVTGACRSCRDPLCMVGCPVGSIRRKDSKEIIIEDWCIGCGLCADQCPYGSIEMHYFRAEEPGSTGNPRAPVKKQAAGCDLCSGYVEPSCVYACPHDSLKRVEPRRFFGNASHRVAGRDRTWGKD